jgi:hypothetical protein
VRTCYEWQENKVKVEGWTKKLKEGLKKNRFMTYLTKPERD